MEEAIATFTTSDDLDQRPLEVVRTHMGSENEHDCDTTLATVAHPRILRQLGLASTG